MYSFVSIRVFSWLTNLPAAEGGLAKKSVLISDIRGPKILPQANHLSFSWSSVAKKKQPSAAFQYSFSGSLLELTGFFEVPDQHIHSQQSSQHDTQPQIAAGFVVAGELGVVEQ